MFIETGVNAGKNDSKGFTAGQNKMKQYNNSNKQKYTQVEITEWLPFLDILKLPCSCEWLGVTLRVYSICWLKSEHITDLN